MARPFFKGQTTRIRPVICAEHLYKFAAGVTLRSARAELTRATGPCQYGFGRPGGAPLEASEIKAAMSANPTWPTLSLDVKNAFGAVTWTSALRVAEEECPQLGLILAGQWQYGHLSLLTERTTGCWTHNEATGSLLQGGHDGHPAFCVILWHYLRKHLGTRVSDPTLRIWLYVDDIVVQAAPETWNHLWPAIKAALDDAGFALCAAKCAWHCPTQTDPT
jgi:hypothetical protein